MNRYVERARQIADALDSMDVEHTLHEQFYAEWKAWEAEDPTRTMRDFDREIGRDGRYTDRIVRGVTAGTRAADWGSGSNKRDDVARKVLRDPEQRKAIIESLTPEERGEIATGLLADPDTRTEVISKVEGISAVEAMHRESGIHKDPVPPSDPLPPPPDFAVRFWAAVSKTQEAYAELQRFGVRDIDARPDTREAAERFAGQAADIRDAVVDHVVNNIVTEEL